MVKFSRTHLKNRILFQGQGDLEFQPAGIRLYFEALEDIIQFLVAQLPYGIQAKDSEGRLPLHYACGNFSLKGLQHLVGLYPDSVRVESTLHGLPIHCACKNSTNLEVVKYLVSLYPESINVYNDEVGLPLHCAESDEVFEHLFHQRYSNTDKPLHDIFQDEKLENKTGVAENFIRFFPGNAQDADSQDSFPLHLAVSAPTNLPFINKLIALNPKAIAKQDSQGALPLHNAARSGASRDIVQCLVSRSSRSAEVVDRQGRTPLHLACHHKASLEVVSGLIQAFPQGVRVRDGCGCVPLHVACRHGSPLDVIQRLVELDPLSLHSVDKNQELPLHKACWGGHTYLVEFLVKTNMLSAHARNELGMLPVFLLCQSSGKSRSCASVEHTPKLVEAIWLLLATYPEAVQSRA